MLRQVILVCLVFTSACSSPTLSNRAPAASSTEIQTHFISIPYGSETLNLRIGVQSPEGEILGDVLYIHGFADRLDNHAPLFSAWNRAGLRVIAFDLPSHGENSGSYNDLNRFDFSDLATLAAKAEQDTKPAEKRPLILAGWSTGGLIVTRLLQKNWTSGFSRPISGAILFAPGVSVRKFPWTFGNRLGMVTEDTLTHDPHPPHVGPIRPDTPFWNNLIAGFSPKLMLNSVLSQDEEYPSSIRTLVFSGGNKEDVYAKEWVVRSWTEDKPNITTISCPHAMHEMDNELPEFGGDEVRAIAAQFAHAIASGSNFEENLKTRGAICSEVSH
jgi:pimeloyl-ACP methyl ester carboxylesterase